MTDLSQLSNEQLMALYGAPATAGAPVMAAGGSAGFDPSELLRVPGGPGGGQPQLTEEQLAAAGQRRVEGDQPLAWSDVPGRAIRNLPSSAYQYGADIANAVLHPVDTLTGIGNAGSGLAQKLGLKSGTEDIPYADAVGQFYKNRFGSMDAIKRTLAEDPIGAVGDFSAVISGPGALAARVPGTVGRVGRAVSTVGRYTDPLTAVTAPAGLAARTASSVLTGVGGDTLKSVADAARVGGTRADDVRDFMRGSGNLEEIVGDADRALEQMRVSRQQQYRTDQRALARDRTVLDFTDIDQSVGRMSDVGTFHGVEWQRSAAPIRNKIINEIDYWKSLDPAVFHTPEGMDVLKKSIGDLANNVDLNNKAGRLVVKEAVDAVKKTITAQAPGYAKMLRAYHNASTAIDTMRSTFSLDDPKKVDAALRKLTSAMRNNVNTNYGMRTKMVDELNRIQPGLKDKIVGSTVNTWEPRGFARIIAGLGGMGQITSAVATGGLGPLATIPLQLAASSPRIAGEVANAIGTAQRYGVGRGGFVTRPARETARQAGREPQRPRVYINTSEFGGR